MKAAVSEFLGRVVARAGGIAPERGAYGRTSLAFWKSLPHSVRNWVGHRVLQPAEIRAQEVVRRRPEISEVLAGVNNTFALSNLSLLVLLELLEKRRPKSIVEFGSGLSTAILAKYAEHEEAAGRPAPLIYSFEHHAEWLGTTSERLASLNLADRVRLRHAPLSEQQLLGRTMSAYTLPVDELSRETADRRFELCIIDGPPREVGRAGGLPIIAPYLAERALILLDDSFRSGEQEALAEWGRNYGSRLGEPQLYLTGGHGLAAVEWTLAT